MMFLLIAFLMGIIVTSLFSCWRTEFLLKRGYTHEEIHSSICKPMEKVND